MVEFAALAGLDDSHLDMTACEHPVHRDLVEPLRELRARAAGAGFEMSVASGWRSFERQLAIWNAKAEGRRPLLDDEGRELPCAALSDEEKLWAILRWSALPGASRHHWGTDVDVYDQGPCRDGYKLQLTFEETRGTGAFADFHAWLGRDLAANPQFFRPYTNWSGGVAPEPWHLSYRPLAAQFEEELQPQPLRGLIERTDIALQTEILANFDEIFARFIKPG